MTALLFITGITLALWIAWRNPGYAEKYPPWPTWPEAVVQDFGVLLICVAIVRVGWGWVVT